MPLRVSLTFELLEGTMCVWMPPPPGDRLFWSFLSPPKLVLRASPEIGGRVLKYAYHASRASAWIQARMELAFRKNMVFPSGGDIPLPLLLPMENPRAADNLPSLREKGVKRGKQEEERRSGGAVADQGAAAVNSIRNSIDRKQAGRNEELDDFVGRNEMPSVVDGGGQSFEPPQTAAGDDDNDDDDDATFKLRLRRPKIRDSSF